MIYERKAMINTSKKFRNLCVGAAAAGLLLFCGMFAQTQAQRDPFAKPSYKKEKKQVPVGTKAVKTGPSTSLMSYAPPAIEARIEYYKRLRETAAANGTAIPKVTSVLTLNEMAVTGIFKTPRGYAAMVEATPIKLSYTIYPGEKFFDGQLVAVEENRLVFRKVTKTGEGKFVASVENKPLKQYSMKAQVEGTAPAQGDRPAEVASSQPVTASDKAIKPTSNPFLSPLDEMNNQPVKTETDKPKKGSKKPVKVAKNSGK
jgi:hypothetical protein